MAMLGLQAIGRAVTRFGITEFETRSFDAVAILAMLRVG
jgi:hypothetical protein